MVTSPARDIAKTLKKSIQSTFLKNPLKVSIPIVDNRIAQTE
jgi:hypothetical protein